MSVLVLKKYTRRSHHFGYQIQRQVESLRRKFSEGNDKVLGVYNGWEFVSNNHPACREDVSRVFLRGVDKSLDNETIYVTLHDETRFEKAILEFNQAYSNNTNLEMEDVIWEF